MLLVLMVLPHLLVSCLYQIITYFFRRSYSKYTQSINSTFIKIFTSDVVKTKMQTDPAKYNKGVIQAARDIVAKEGAGFLLAGLGPTVVGYGLEGALKFGCYESFKKLFAHLTPSKFINFLLASVIAGAVASVVLVS